MPHPQNPRPSNNQNFLKESDKNSLKQYSHEITVAEIKRVVSEKKVFKDFAECLIFKESKFLEGI